MFTDIQGSSELWDRLKDSFRPTLDRHNQLLHDLAVQWDGYEVKSQGDALMVAFRRGTDAVYCALEMQRALALERWPEEVGELLVRIGIHSCEPQMGYDGAGRLDYFGPSVNRAARIGAAGHGGQVLLSASTWDSVRETLRDEVQAIEHGVHRLRGLEEPERLVEIRREDLPIRRFPPLRTLEGASTSLPLFDGPFVGRAKQLADLRKALMAPGTRLITLVGFGGMGKTRLAVMVAELCAGNFRDGARHIPLEEITEPEPMRLAIASALGLTVLPGVSASELLAGYLRERQCLLVLDNLEQIAEGGLVVRELLAAAPSLKCLVTSRRRLHLRGERVFELPPMPAKEAERLFIETACAADAEFQLTAENTADLCELCRRLEGIPLAIELAAAHATHLTPREILRRLTDRFRLLRAPGGDFSPRQQALAATLEWSYSLLSETDRHLLNEVSVFVGGFELVDAEAVLPGFDLLEGLRRLQSHSLLRTEVNHSDQTTHYSLLETIREFAAARLASTSAAAERVASAHAEYFLEAAAGAVALLRTARQREAARFFARNLGNLRAATEWTESHWELERSVHAAWILSRALTQRGHWSEARGLLLKELARVERCTESGFAIRKLHAEVLFHLASLAIDMGLHDEAERESQICLGLRRGLEDPIAIAEAQNLVGTAALVKGRLDAARELFRAAHRQIVGDAEGLRGKVLHNLALVAVREKDYRRARRLYRLALNHRHAAGDAAGEATTLGNMGVMAYHLGEMNEAADLYERALRLFEMLDDRYGMALMLSNLAEVQEDKGNMARATEQFIEAERLLSSLLSPHVSFPRAALRRLGH